MTYGTILSELYRRLNFASTPDASVTTRLAAFLNLAHRQLLGLPGMDKLRDDTFTFASVSAQARYGLPPNIARIRGVHDRTNDRRLTQRSLDWVRSADPGLDASGISDCFIPVGLTAVAKQPSDASQIFVDSTAAGDNGAAYLEGFRTGGYPTSLTVNMNGATAVSFSATITDIVEITKFYLATAAVGTVTLHEDAEGGTELARIPIGQTASRYWGVQLYPTPSSVITYYVDYTRTIPDMSIANDQPLLPEDFHWLLVEAVLEKEWQKKDDQRSLEARAAYEQGVKALKYFVNCPPDYLPVLGRGHSRRLSRLGGQYPVDAY